MVCVEAPFRILYFKFQSFFSISAVSNCSYMYCYSYNDYNLESNDFNLDPLDTMLAANMTG